MALLRSVASKRFGALHKSIENTINKVVDKPSVLRYIDNHDEAK